MRHSYLVCYDISDPRRWRIIHKLMLAYGEPLQLSVFLCDLSPVEYERMMGRLLRELNRSEDALAVASLGPQDTCKVETYGQTRWEHGKRLVVV